MTWDTARLRATLEDLRRFGDDTTLIECKRVAGGMPESIGETLSAFANMPEGGTILLGIDEHSGFRPSGVANAADLQKKVANFCRQAVTPAPQLNFFDIDIDGVTVLAVTVSPLLPSQKPSLYSGKAWLRHADGDYVMNANDLRMIQVSALHESERYDFDMKVLPGTRTNQLDESLLRQYIATVRSSNSRLNAVQDDSLVLQLTNVTDATGNLRLAGLYAMGYLPQSTEPALGATAAVRLVRTEGGGRHTNLVDIDGPLPDLIEQTVSWIAQNIDVTSYYGKDGHLSDHPEFPLSAVREVVANAFVHRDLGPALEVGKRVEVRLSKSALIIVNPGGLRGLSVAQLESRKLAKAPVNQRLYAIAKNLETANRKRLIEGEGGGIREVLIAMQEARCRPPKFVDTGVQFKVIFPRGPRFSESEQRWLREFHLSFSAPQEDLLIALHRGETHSLTRLRSEYSPLSEDELRSHIDALIQDGIIVQDDDSLALTLSDQWKNEHAIPNDSPSSSTMHNSTSTIIRKASVEGHPRFEELTQLGKNVGPLLQTMWRISHGQSAGTPEFTLRDIEQGSGLSMNQIRYALGPLLDANVVAMNGGQGTHGTTYSFTASFLNEATSQ